jgi:hypothetical protein
MFHPPLSTHSSEGSLVPWRLFRFLQQQYSELGGNRALDALRHGRVDSVLIAAENTATGAFS